MKVSTLTLTDHSRHSRRSRCVAETVFIYKEGSFHRTTWRKEVRSGKSWGLKQAGQNESSGNIHHVIWWRVTDPLAATLAHVGWWGQLCRQGQVRGRLVVRCRKAGDAGLQELKSGGRGGRRRGWSSCHHDKAWLKGMLSFDSSQPSLEG